MLEKGNKKIDSNIKKQQNMKNFKIKNSVKRNEN